MATSTFTQLPNSLCGLKFLGHFIIPFGVKNIIKIEEIQGKEVTNTTKHKVTMTHERFPQKSPSPCVSFLVLVSIFP